MFPFWLGIGIAALYGLVIGSFLNVCIYRWPAGVSIATPPSHCPVCNHRLSGLDLVPLFSFLLLGRKCRYCKTPISWQYFTVELITGIAFVATYMRYHMSIDWVVYSLFAAALIVAFVVDMEQFIIPDEVSIAGVILGIGRDVAHIIAGDADKFHSVVHIPVPFLHWNIPMLSSIIGLVVCGGIFYLIAYVSFYVFRPSDKAEQEEYEGAMGGGDVKLAAAIGACVGWALALGSFLIAVMLGAIVGVGMIVAKSKAEKKNVHWRTEIPFGPYMVIGALAVIWFAPQIGMLWKMWIGLVAPA